MSARRAVRVVGAFAAVFALHAIAAEPTQEVQLTPDDLHWRAFPSLPPGAQVSILYGDPKKDGPLVFRMKLPPNYRVPAHSTRSGSTITVISGTLYRGIGDKFDQGKLKALPAGSFVVHASDEKVFIATEDQYVVLEVHGRGPLGITYVNPGDDPRQKK